MKNLKDYISIKEAAEFLGVCEMTLRRWDKAGKLKAYRNPMSNYRLYKKTELKSFLKEISKTRKRQSKSDKPAV